MPERIPDYQIREVPAYLAEQAIEGLLPDQYVVLADILKRETDPRYEPTKSGVNILLAIFKRYAVNALIDLAKVDSTNQRAVIALQSDVARYTETAQIIERFIALGDEAYEQMTAEEKAAFEKALGLGADMTTDGNEKGYEE